ncbi:protein SRC1-like isoform X1 [Rhododendron vialii]|uniref:protein SRC1-like isoform X1 n=1 Tax=Rhododendron vialii TaxID=182163 RepID=UPI00265E10F1|nr:protein SRC1-like isoform X1 [Rhododendron vialii]
MYFCSSSVLALSAYKIKPVDALFSSHPIPISRPTYTYRERKKKEDREEKMAGIMNKIGETLHMGGKKEGEQHKGEGQHMGEGQHKTEQHCGEQHHGGEGQRKEGGGLMDKVKDKIHGGGGTGGTQDHENKGEKKKKKEKKKKHEGGHDSSSSDSD